MATGKWAAGAGKARGEETTGGEWASEVWFVRGGVDVTREEA